MQPHSASPPADLPRLDLRQPTPGSPFASSVAAELEHIDPLKSGWVTEAVGEEIKEQFKKSSKLISHAETIQPDKLAPLVESTARVGRLGPLTMKPAFSNTVFVVTRCADPAESPAVEPLRGVEGLAAALRDSVQPFDASVELRVEFKVFRVETTDETWMSDAFYQVTGTTPDGRRQQNATWRCCWTRAPPDAPTIVSRRYQPLQQYGADELKLPSV